MADPQVLRPVLETVVIIGMTFLAGIAGCLGLWALPLIMLPENTAKSMIAQFNELIRRGGKYLQPSSRLCAISLVLLAILTSRHGDTTISSRWKIYAVSAAVIGQVAWYEVVFIFPINDEITLMGVKSDGKRKDTFSHADREKLMSLLQKWRRLHWIRISLPLVAAVIALQAVL